MITTPAPRAWLAAVLLAVACFVLLIATPRAVSEQASSNVRTAQAGYLDAGDEHTCAVLTDRSVRCWGKGLAGRLGYGNEQNMLSASAGGPVNLGPGRSARAVVSGDYHSCAIVDDGSVRCWGFGANGRLGYASTANVLSPVSAPPVDLGPGRTATAITAGASHTCAILDNGSVRCWGNGVSGRLGYGNQSTIGDNETPAAAGPVDIGAGRRAIAISAGDFHTCAIRDDGSLLCWGFGSGGQLGKGNTADIGDDETPAAAGPVALGRAARAVSGGKGHTCAILDDGSARCWGFGADGRLGYGSESSITTASAAPPIALGAGRTATAISAGEAHSCAVLDNGSVRCWGFGGNGRLGYDSTTSIGDDSGETPATAGPVALGSGRTARAITAGFSHTCALLDDGTLRCWGFGGSGRLGYGDEDSVGDDPTRSVASAGPVPIGAQIAPVLADLSLTVSPSTAQLAVGGTVNVTVGVTNAGPDATSGVAVGLPPPAGLTYRVGVPSQGAWDGNAGAWQIGSLAPGARVTLQVTVVASTAGSHVLAAEISASGVFDPSSTPGNGGAEDDRGLVTVAVPSPPGSGASTPLAKRLLPRSLALSVARAPKKGRVRTLSVKGRLVLPRAKPALRCGGKVRLRVNAGKRIVASKTVALRAKRGVCGYTATLRPKKLRTARTLSVTATFLGTSLMRPRSARAVKVPVIR